MALSAIRVDGKMRCLSITSMHYERTGTGETFSGVTETPTQESTLTLFGERKLRAPMMIRMIDTKIVRHKNPVTCITQDLI